MPRGIAFEEIRPELERLAGDPVTLTVGRLGKPGFYVASMGTLASVNESSDTINEILAPGTGGGITAHIVATAGQDPDEPGYSTFVLPKASYVDGAALDEGGVMVRLEGDVIVGVQSQAIENLLLTGDLPWT
jgi:hypothetical protein